MVEGVAVGAAMLPCLIGGVIGAGMGSLILYAGAVEAGEAEDIFSEGAPTAAAHAPYEMLKQEQGVKINAASAYERRPRISRGFAAMFQ